MNALSILLLAMIVVVTAVMVFRLHAFLALMAAAIVVTLLTSYESVFLSTLQTTSGCVITSQDNTLTLQTPPKWKTGSSQFVVLPPASLTHIPKDLETISLQFKGGSLYEHSPETSPPDLNSLIIPIDQYAQAKSLASQSGISRIADGFGQTAMKIGILIAMASVLGRCLLISGSAQVIVDTIRKVCGEKQTPIALVISSFFLAIPLFFDTVFLLLLPLAKAMSLQTGKDYVKNVLAIVAGGTLAHSLIPPTPGPLLIAAELQIPLPVMFLTGMAIGSIGIVAGYLYVLWANRSLDIPLREDLSLSNTSSSTQITNRPPFWLAVLPLLLPLVFLGTDFLWPHLTDRSPMMFSSSLTPIIEFWGDKNIALTVSAFVAFFTMWSMPGMTKERSSEHVQSALSEGGTVLLITCAGGALGTVIQQTNIAGALIESFPVINSGPGLLTLAFLVTMVIRVAQGSATVAMITAVGIFAPIASTIVLPFHPVYLAMAIGCGSKPLPWMNDSGFWVVGKMSGFTEKETLQTFSVLLTIMGIVAFFVTLIASRIVPLI